MEKRAFIFILVSMLVLLLYPRLFVLRRPQPLEGKSSQLESETAEAKPEALTVTPGKKRAREGEDIIVETDLYRMVLTTSGARLKSCRLKGYEETKVQKGDLERQLSGIESTLEKKGGAGTKLTRERERLKELLKREPLPGEGAELVPFDGDFYGDYPLTVNLPALDERGDLNSDLYQASQKELKLDEKRDSGTIEFRYRTEEGIGIRKLFSFSRDSYLIGLEIAIENSSSREISEENFLIVYGPDVGLVKKGQLRGRQVSHFVSWVEGKLERDTTEKGFFKKPTMVRGVTKLLPGLVGWTALRDSYFAAALIPEGEIAGARLVENEDGTREIALQMLPFSLPEGGEVTRKLSLYLGPQEVEALQKSGSHLEAIIDFGFWTPVAKAIHWLLKTFHRWLGNYGLSIILLSLTIKLAFYPFTHKSFESMRKMQEDMKTLQPEIEDLRAKYKDNPQKLNKATMELYRKRGVNPLGGCKGGCLPMLFQMPVFFSLYAVLYNAIELRQAPFFGWIDDLSAPDPYKVLPLLMGATMFLQQKMTGTGTSGSAQPEQAKMMNIMMTIFFTFIFLNFPSGIVLYWLCFNVFTSLQQLLVKKKSS